MTVILHNEHHRLVIDLGVGARAVSWQAAGHELLTSIGEHPIHYGMYPMAPWAGRLRANTYLGNLMPVNFAPWAIHGVFLTEAFVCTGESTPTHLQAGASAKIAGHVVRCDIAWELDGPDVRTLLQIQVSGGELPVLLGWHPWFQRVINGHGAEWEIVDAHLLKRGPDGLPTGEQIPRAALAGPFDDVFQVPDCRARIHWGVLTLDIVNSHPWFVVFDEQTEGVCIEPQTGPPNATNDPEPVVVAKAGHPIAMRTTWSLTSAST